MQNLYESIFYSAKVNALFSNEAIIGAMLRFESALAKAQAKFNLIPASAAKAIEASCTADKINIEQIIEKASLGGNINIPLIKQLTALVKKENEEASRYVHFGATSQDVIDTALMLQLKQATEILASDLDKLVQGVTAITKEHRKTLMVGRSFMQHARPITFGYKTAGWLDGLTRSKQAIQNLLKETFVLQLGGAVGTLSAMQEKAIEISETVSDDLGLALPPKPWHTQRDRIALIAMTFGILAGNIGKIARDISLLMQTEIAEVSEAAEKGKGGSSTMPHKKNPVGCISILANVERIPGLVQTVLSCMVQDHERATGAWHAEWQTIEQIVQLTAGALHKAVELINGLEVDREKMLQNIELTRGLIFAENLSFSLAAIVGKSEANSLIQDCIAQAKQKQVHLKTVVANHPLIAKQLSPEKIENFFDLPSSIGACDEFINRVLSASQH